MLGKPVSGNQFFKIFWGGPVGFAGRRSADFNPVLAGKHARAPKIDLTPYAYGSMGRMWRTSIPLATHQFPTHVLCILSSTVSPPALNSSAGTSSGPVALRLAVWRTARATSALAYAEKARPICAGDNSNGECVAYTHVRPAGNTDAHVHTQVTSEL